MSSIPYRHVHMGWACQQQYTRYVQIVRSCHQAHFIHTQCTSKPTSWCSWCYWSCDFLPPTTIAKAWWWSIQMAESNPLSPQSNPTNIPWTYSSNLAIDPRLLNLNLKPSSRHLKIVHTHPLSNSGQLLWTPCQNNISHDSLLSWSWFLARKIRKCPSWANSKLFSLTVERQSNEARCFSGC